MNGQLITVYLTTFWRSGLRALACGLAAAALHADEPAPGTPPPEEAKPSVVAPAATPEPAAPRVPESGTLPVVAEPAHAAPSLPPAAAAPAPVSAASVSDMLESAVGRGKWMQPVTGAEPAATANATAVPAAELTSPNLIPVGGGATNVAERSHDFQVQLDMARQQRIDKSNGMAAKSLIGLLEGPCPMEIKRGALLELALVAQDEGLLPRALQIYSQFQFVFPQDASVPEVLLRQGLIYRQMGANTLALTKFYAVMTSALNLKLDQLEYYQRLVLQAKTEIADTYYLDGKYAEARDFFERLLKEQAPELNKTQIEFKLIRCLDSLKRHAETIGHARMFLKSHPEDGDAAEVRFLLALALKQQGRNRDALQEVLALLESEHSTARQHPEDWVYWQQRAGNEIANQLYKEADYLNALEIYLTLAGLDKAPAWQVPVWYQIGLVYERLEQSQRANEMYDKILGRQKEVTEGPPSAGLQAVLDMARWRKAYLGWKDQADRTEQELRRSISSLRQPVTPP